MGYMLETVAEGQERHKERTRYRSTGLRWKVVAALGPRVGARLRPPGAAGSGASLAEGWHGLWLRLPRAPLGTNCWPALVPRACTRGARRASRFFGLLAPCRLLLWSDSAPNTWCHGGWGSGWARPACLPACRGAGAPLPRELQRSEELQSRRTSGRGSPGSGREGPKEGQGSRALLSLSLSLLGRFLNTMSFGPKLFFFFNVSALLGTH